MHHLAEYGIAAHWKYKEGEGDEVNLEWLKNLAFLDESTENFLRRAKNDLFSEDVLVFSPKGKGFTFPKGSTALDFAYAVHSEIGDKADVAYINKKKASLLTVLKNGDVIRVETAEKPVLHCSWYSSVKTSKAKAGIKSKCNQRIREVNEMSGFNILSTIFDIGVDEVKNVLGKNTSSALIERIPTSIDALKEKVYKIAKNSKMEEVKPWEFFKKGYKRLSVKTIDSLKFFTNKSIDKVEFDYCCHPKAGDDIVAIYKDGSAVIHHKLCKKAYKEIADGVNMVYVEWASSKFMKYRLTVALQNRKGVLAKLLLKLSEINLNVIAVNIGIYRSDIAKYCTIDLESEKLSRKEIKEEISKKFKLIDIIALDDAYNKK